MLKIKKDRLIEEYEQYKKWFADGILPEKTYCTLRSNGISSWNGMEYYDGDTLEVFMARKGIADGVKYPPVCYGYFHDGMYHEQWYFNPSEKKGGNIEEATWQKEVDVYLDGLNPDDVLVGVDIHM